MIFRGKTKEGEWPEGCLIVSSDNRCAIVQRPTVFAGSWRKMVMISVDEVIPETVAISTGLFDKTKWENLMESEREIWTKAGNMPSEWKGREIFGSIPIDGKMSKGGDVVKCSISETQHFKGNVLFEKGHFYIQSFWYRFNPIGRWDLQKAPLSGKSNTKIDIRETVDKVIGNQWDNADLLKESMKKSKIDNSKS